MSTSSFFKSPAAGRFEASVTEPERGGSTLIEERVEPSLDHGDHERFAHYVEKEKITEALVMGTPVRALCGKIWVPSRDASKFPVCPTCKEIFEGPGWADEPEDAGSSAGDA